LKIYFENGVFVAEGDECPAGFHRDPIESNYKTKKIRAAWRLRDYFSGSLKVSLKRFTLRNIDLNARRLIYPKGLSLRPHQSEGVTFALSRNHSYIAYRMRLGKSVIGIVTSNTLEARTLLVVPPGLIPVWERELEKWAEIKAEDVQVLTGRTSKVHDRYRWVICPHSILDRPEIQRAIKNARFDLVLVDEAHRFKSHEAARTKALFGQGFDIQGIVHLAKRVVLFSGTPMLNRPMEVFAALQALAHNLIKFMTYEEFGMKYCAGKTLMIKGHFGREKKVYDFRGASNVLELRKATERFFLFKMDSDEKENIEQVVIPLRYQISKPLQTAEKEIRNKYSLDDLLDNPSVGGLAELRKSLGASKVIPASELINDELQFTADSILVLAWHKEVINHLAIELRRWQPLTVQGGVSSDARHQIQTKFQSKKARVIIAQISTMEGFDFSAANQVFFVEYDWTPGRNDQARFRVMALGKEDFVSIKYLVAENTLDEYILDRQGKKKSHINQFTKGE
jgi:SNF2 family DNA or RNA helicase